MSCSNRPSHRLSRWKLRYCGGGKPGNKVYFSFHLFFTVERLVRWEDWWCSLLAYSRWFVTAVLDRGVIKRRRDRGNNRRWDCDSIPMYLLSTLYSLLQRIKNFSGVSFFLSSTILFTSYCVGGDRPLRFCLRLFYGLIISLCLFGFLLSTENIHPGRSLLRPEIIVPVLKVYRYPVGYGTGESP